MNPPTRQVDDAQWRSLCAACGLQDDATPADVEAYVARSRNPAWKHGHTVEGRTSVEFRAWAAMLGRCRPSHRQAKDYYRRGIRVCVGWRQSFVAFFKAVGPRPSAKHSLDRKNNDGGYWCGRCAECRRLGHELNCRWATRVEQTNNSRHARLLTLNGVTRTMKQWAAVGGIPYYTFRNRLDCGWSLERALATPLDTTRRPRVYYNGSVTSLRRIAREKHISRETLRARLARGLTIEQAIKGGD